MSDEIVWGAGMDDAEFNRGIKRMLKDIDTLKQKLKEAQEEQNKHSKKNKDNTESELVALRNLYAGWNFLQLSIRAASAELEHYHETNREAAAETIHTADSQIKFFRNLGNVSREESRKVQQAIKDIAAAVKQPASNVYAVASEAISAQGNLSRAQMFDNVKMAMRLAPESLQEATALAGMLGDVASLTGTGDTAQNAGLMLALGEQARIPNMQQIGKNIIPSAIGVKQTLPGTAANDAMALVTTLTSAAKDKEGAISGTAAVQLAQQLDSLFGDDAKQPGRKDKAGALLKRLGDGSLIEQIGKLQNDPKARAAFFEKASFEAKAKPFVEELLTAGSPTAKLFEQNRAKVPTGAAAAAQAEQFFGNVADAPEQQIAGTQRALGSIASEIRLGNSAGARAGVIRDEMLNALKPTGGWLLQKKAGLDFDLRRGILGQSPEEAGASVIENRIKSVSDPQLIAKLNEMIAELRGARKDQKNAPKPKNIDQHTE